MDRFRSEAPAPLCVKLRARVPPRDPSADRPTRPSFSAASERSGVVGPPSAGFAIYLNPHGGFGRSWARWTRRRCRNVSLVDVEIQNSLDRSGFVLEREYARSSPESGRRRLEMVRS
ncbi:hypothetical protein MA16_Dca009373 [Dendrobium catenatum]|uniref:Uncharacterized protein n=1 Tax=Dendrobium catenatum TaxID=906689 RepID=A0A2I0XH37_9ASPA|nr:hypothetical protein MA16_Dca009373 [Dendrobium catenatum]